MSLRDDLERVLRAWDKHETAVGAPPIIDYDCHPGVEVDAAPSRLVVLPELLRLKEQAVDADQRLLVPRIDADLAYLRTLLGEQQPLGEYIQVTQGCSALGWPEERIVELGSHARQRLAEVGISWGPDTMKDLNESEGLLEPDAVPDAIQRKHSGTPASD